MKTSSVCALLGAVASAALLTMSAVPASAADLGYGSVKDIPPPAPSGRAWYLRGTIGMSNSNAGSIWAEEFASGTVIVHHKDIKSSPLFGFGIGVEHSRWLRFDITGEYRGKQHFVAHDTYDNRGPGEACNDGDPGELCGANDHSANLSTWLGLANAYVDLGTWHGVTPYVGGGVGFATITTMGYKDVNVVSNGFWLADKDKTTTNFAWALYAGLAYDVTPQLTLDFGYRYTDLGTVKTGAGAAYNGGVPGQGIEIRDITSHDLLLTARYRLGGHQPMYPVAFK
ncbi:MAG TPA: TonB-dependent receptor [Hyphomicrobium sp.]|nr:TonB-dependent receptor [Hyphomicrobium sp.]